jgi:hypothetical protein
MNNVTDFPTRDLIAELKGPENSGYAVFIHGRCIPNLAMYDRGDEIEFILDHRLSVSFPRDQAWNAVAFAFGAMALGAGCDPLNFEPKPFASRVAQLPQENEQ